MRRTHRLLAAALLAAACDFVTGPGGADVVMDVSGARAGVEGARFLVDFEVRNRGGETAYIANRCGDLLRPSLYIRQSGKWELLVGGVCTANLDMSPWPLAPGERLRGTAFGERAGTFQLRVRAQDATGERDVSIESNAFRWE